MNKCRIILSGGGTKCCYQISFLRELLQSPKFRSRYDITEFYGTSFGALVGFCACLGEFDELTQFFKTLTKDSLVPWFNMWGSRDYINKIPLVGYVMSLTIDLIWIMTSIGKKGMYNPKPGEDFLNKISINSDNNLKNFYCTF